jgi:hypothetical protein
VDLVHNQALGQAGGHQEDLVLLGLEIKAVKEMNHLGERKEAKRAATAGAHRTMAGEVEDHLDQELRVAVKVDKAACFLMLCWYSADTYRFWLWHRRVVIRRLWYVFEVPSS